MQTLLRPLMNSSVVNTVATLYKLVLVSSLLLYLMLVSLPTPIPYTGHFHTPVKHVHISLKISSNISIFHWMHLENLTWTQTSAFLDQNLTSFGYLGPKSKILVILS